MYFSAYLYAIVFVLLITSCTKSKEDHSRPGSYTGATGWLVPEEDLVLKNGAHDQIKAIDEPVFYSFEEANLDPNEKVFIYKINNLVNIYPLEILWHHEIINDNYLDHYFSITYCPLTGSGISWDRTINGEPTTFGVSGHLYNHNLVPYDRATESYWSQMGLQSIKGSLGGNPLEIKSLLLTTALTAKESFPQAMIVYNSSNHFCDSICTNPETKSGHEIVSSFLPAVEYFGVVFRQHALLFEEDSFADSIELIKTNFKSYRLLLAGSKTKQFNTAFLIPANHSNTKFSPVQNALPIIMKDDSNNFYDLMGFVIDGPNTGTSLDSPPSFWAKAFAWELFYQELNIYEK